MKFSKPTLEILQNFAAINQSVRLMPGTEQKTISTGKSICAIANLDIEIPAEIAIYDLSQFLGVLSLFDDPDIDLEGHYLTINEGNRRVRYRLSNPEILNVPQIGSLDLDNFSVKFSLEKSDLQAIFKAAKLLDQTELAIKGENGVLSLVTRNPKDENASNVSFTIGETSQEFEHKISIDYMKILQHNYDIAVVDDILVKFTSRELDVTYLIPLEAV